MSDHRDSALAFEPEAAVIRSLAAGMLAGLPAGGDEARRRVGRVSCDGSVMRCVCGSWRVRGRECPVCMALALQGRGTW